MFVTLTGPEGKPQTVNLDHVAHFSATTIYHRVRWDDGADPYEKIDGTLLVFDYAMVDVPDTVEVRESESYIRERLMELGVCRDMRATVPLARSELLEGMTDGHR